MSLKAVVGSFEYLDDLLETVHYAKENNIEYRVYSPIPHHDIEDATMPGRSPVRFITLTGAITGLISGFTLATMASLDYPIRTSAKEIASIPAFIVVGFECTILFGGVCTLFALLHWCRLPQLFRQVGFKPKFTQDRFGIALGCKDNETAEQFESELQKRGAESVEIQDGL